MIKQPATKCRRKREYEQTFEFSKCRDRIRLCPSHYNLMDNVAFNLVGYSAWYPWLDICNLLCYPVHVK